MRVLAAGLLLALSPTAARAQAYQCRPPSVVEPIPRIVPDGPPSRAAISGYTLSASWSPDYCKMSGDTSSLQCSGRNGRFGFVLHGLWPQSARGASPQWCAQAPTPAPEVLRRNLCMSPSARLLAREWAKHGTCMAKNPAQYFNVGAILWRSIRWPDADRLSLRQDLTAGDLRRAFVAENPAWRTEQIGLETSRSGWLRALRLCYSQRFLPTRCDRRGFGPADAAPLRIWRGL